MKVLVTGGAGFIGSEFCRALASGNYLEFGIDPSGITVLDSLTYASNLDNLQSLLADPNFKFVHASLNDKEIVDELVSVSDLILNFAAESHVDNSIVDATSFISSNVAGVATLLEALKKRKTARMIQISTDEVYGSIQHGSWDEKQPLEPNSPYAASKASGDLLVRAYVKTHGLDVVLTRCSNNYGPYQHTEKLIPTLISRILLNRPLPIYGSGSNIREWIHVGDHSRAIALVASKGVTGEIYNIGSGDEYTNLEIANLLIELASSSSTIEYVPDRLGHDQRYSLNTSKIFDLGWGPRIEFRSGLRDTFEWYKKNSLKK
jgi:dTDP-glucose 4,6-dehydratase